MGAALRADLSLLKAAAVTPLERLTLVSQVMEAGKRGKVPNKAAIVGSEA